MTELTPKTRELLEMLAEEAAEVVQAVTKILRHGPHSYNPTLPEDEQISNMLHLRKELNELRAIEWELESTKLLLPTSGANIAAAWRKKLRYTHHQGEEQTAPSDHINDRPQS